MASGLIFYFAATSNSLPNHPTKDGTRRLFALSGDHQSGMLMVLLDDWLLRISTSSETLVVLAESGRLYQSRCDVCSMDTNGILYTVAQCWAR